MLRWVVPLAFVLGSVLGSFLNVVIFRTIARIKDQESPLRQGFGGQAGSRHYFSNASHRSVCPHCERVLRWWELVPIFSFIGLNGRCQRCGGEISVQYPLVEAGLGVVAAIVAAQALASPATAIAGLLEIIIAALLVVLFIIDLKTMLLPDGFIVGLLVAVITFRVFTYALSGTSASLVTELWGPAIGAGFLLLLWILTKGRGIGLGDVKLMIPLGLLAGPLGTVALLFIAYMIGGLLALYLLLRKHATLTTALPFGPFLCGAAVLLLVWPALPEYLVTLLLGYNPWV